MPNKSYSRNEVVNLARSWLGRNEKDGSHKLIIDTYNSFGKEKLPRHILMQYDWAWCACTWSALAIDLGYTDIMPIEISCGNLIQKAKDMGVWVENDGYVPSPGDAILYDWQDNGKLDCTGWPDHVGMVETVDKSSGYFVVIEGNYSDSVKRRTMSINGKYIRGFITPRYTDDNIDEAELPSIDINVTSVAREVIAGSWGNNPIRKEKLTSAGYNYDEVQAEVTKILQGNIPTSKDPIFTDAEPYESQIKCTCNAEFDDPTVVGYYLTTANLYCRNDAGSNKKALCLIPKGSLVWCYGSRTNVNGVNWLCITFVMNRIKYTGFSCAKYLEPTNNLTAV